MSDVKRYEAVLEQSEIGTFVIIEEEKDGDLVNYADYEKLEAENKRLKGDNEKIAEFIGYPKCFKNRSFLDAVLEACEYS